MQLSLRPSPTARPLRPRGQRRAAVVVAGLSDEQQQAALKWQLEKSSKRAQQAEPSTSAPASAAEPSLEARQAAARAWVTPWLEAQARRRSAEVQGQLRQRVALISTDEEHRALRRLLFGGSGSSMDEEAVVVAQEEVIVAAAKPAAPVATPPPAATSGPLAGAKSFEDGSLLFTADMLQAVSYEDVLHPC